MVAQPSVVVRKRERADEPGGLEMGRQSVPPRSRIPALYRHSTCFKVVMVRVRPWAFAALLTVGIADGAPAADPIPAEDDYSYLAVIAGACEQLVVDGRAVTDVHRQARERRLREWAGCVHVQRTSRRDAGRHDLQRRRIGATRHPRLPPHGRSPVDDDRLAPGRVTHTVVVVVVGTCTMRGDPTHEQTHFECRLERAGKETVGRFVTSGCPTVHAGARNAGSEVDRAEKDPTHASSPIAVR